MCITKGMETRRSINVIAWSTGAVNDFNEVGLRDLQGRQTWRHILMEVRGFQDKPQRKEKEYTERRCVMTGQISKHSS